MKYRQYGQLLAVFMLLLVVACSNETRTVSMQTTLTPAKRATPTSLPTVPVVQQPLPKGLFKPGYPVMDWVFNITCSRAIDSYNSSQMQTALAYDSSAWLYPSDGHLVEGWQDCDNAALMRQARNQGLP
ncbi:MAG: hypothetical protein ACJ788_00965, partial [Ktedonobacteraceae bacterium]